MEYIRQSYISDTAKPIQKADVTFIWSSDGWCYVPELKLRQRYTEHQYFFESWEGIIAPVLSVENVSWALYSHVPRVWRESFEIFEEVKKNNTTKSSVEIREGQPPSPCFR